MQTFLPFEDFTQTAQVLDYRRLGKQRVECLQILKALNDPKNGWHNHPAVKMWRGHDYYLRLYGIHMIDEWVRRGYNNTMDLSTIDVERFGRPKWLGNPEVHSQYRGLLLYKDPKWYGQFGWTDKPRDKIDWTLMT